MSAGRVVSAKKAAGRAPNARASTSEIAERVPLGLYGPIVIPEEQKEAVARLCLRHEGADSQAAQMLGVLS